MDNLYEFIETLAKKKGYKNITEFCRVAGIPRATMSELKSGRTKNLSAETLAKIASHFSLSIDCLLGNRYDFGMRSRVKYALESFSSANPDLTSNQKLDLMLKTADADLDVLCYNYEIDKYYLLNWLRYNEIPPAPIVDQILLIFDLAPQDIFSTQELAIYNEYKEDYTKAPTPENERSVSHDEIKFALFRGREDITDAMYQEVLNFAEYVARREEEKKKKE